jgi:N6-adenosine-specific RNA methylase IME4
MSDEENYKLIERNQTLPATIEELIDFVIVGNEAVQSFKAKLRACNKSENAKVARDQALQDGRKVSHLVLEAEARLGELLEQIPISEIRASSARGTCSLPIGINKKESHYAQEIYRNPQIVDQIWNDKKNDIPTRHDVLKAIKHKKREQKIQEQKEEIIKGIEKPDGLYDIIAVDPPWEFDGGEKSYDADGRRTTASYPTMSYDEIREIEIPAKDDCILWLWTTHKDIWGAKKILEHWEFEYKGMIVWDKEKMGIGSWLRFQCEFCLLGIKGKPLWENKNIRDILREPRTKHSVKPECFYQMIDENFVGKKIDYFGRKKREGWDIYGAGQNSV